MTAYHVPPACQGQIVRRTTDRSDLSVSYSMIELEDDEIDGIEPWNTEPSPQGEWKGIDSAKAERIANEGP